MITLHKLEWNNWFSYGDNNVIEFDKDTVTQIIGKNGSGKSSIMLILQEMLYGKNSAGIKKTALRNRYGDKKLSGKLSFSKGPTSYTIKLQRTSALSISLEQDGEDISAHTAAGTYKQIENILGIDFKTFEQIVYQSSISSLQFLTATDSNRKQFLIGLLNLNEYLDLHEKFKKIHKDINARASHLEGEIAATKKWLDSSVIEDVDYELIDVPEVDEGIKDKLVELSADARDIDRTNKRILANKKKIEDLQELRKILPQEELGEKPDNLEEEKKELASLQASRTYEKSMLSKLINLDDKCPTCLQSIDQDLKNSMCTDHEINIDNIELRMSKLQSKINEASLSIIEWENHKKLLEKYEVVQKTIDSELENKEVKNIEDLKDEISLLKSKIKKMEEQYNNAIKYNSDIEAKIIHREETLKKFTEQNEFVKNAEKEASELLNLKVKLKILQDAFSTKGLVSYKIEFMIKDLEVLINKYLGELSDGRFQLFFTLNGDKLNVTINDNGVDVDISALSMGERSRVNSATLLSIRTIMSDLSDDKINLLFLDEILGTLDDFGKEKLIELLLEEHNLNTFLVSHEYTHPLLDKLTVIKTDNISRIENG